MTPSPRTSASDGGSSSSRLSATGMPYDMLATQVATVGGAPARKLAWLYAQLSTRDVIERDALFNDLCARMDSFSGAVFTDEEWLGWIDDRLAEVSSVAVAGPGAAPDANASGELMGLTRVRYWLASRSDGWQGMTGGDRERHSARVGARAEMLVVAGSLGTRYGGDKEVRSLDRRLCHRTASRLYAISREWTGLRVATGDLRNWFTTVREGVPDASVQSAARSWCWQRDVPEVVAQLSKLDGRLSEFGGRLVKNEITVLSRAHSTWDESVQREND